MTVASTLVARAPGVYTAPPGTLRALTGVRMDVCGFVGIAPRGPVREPGEATPWPWAAGADGPALRRTVPVAVESWDEYLALFGGFEGPGLLPYAVHTFFRQGGRRAWVARVVHGYGDERDAAGAAAGSLPGLSPRGLDGLPVRAAVAGDAGEGVRGRLRWDVSALEVAEARGAVLALRPPGSTVAGALLRLGFGDGSRRFARVEAVRREARPGGEVDRVVLAEAPPGEVAVAELVEAELEAEAPGGATETMTGLGLHPAHPRWLARVLEDESALLAPDPRWRDEPLLPADVALADPTGRALLAGSGPGRRARGRLPGLAPLRDGLWLEARSEGAWGDALRAEARFTARPVLAEPDGPASLQVGRDAPVPAGALLRFTAGDGSRTLRFVAAATEVWAQSGERVRILTLDDAAPLASFTVEVVEVEVRVREAAARREGRPVPREERHAGLGLHPLHPRFVHRELGRASRLVRPLDEWEGRAVDPVDPDLPPLDSGEGGFHGGADRWADVVPADFFDPAWTPAEEASGEGVHALARAADLSLLVVPDLYSPGPLPPVPPAEPPAWGEDRFAPCVPRPEPPEPGRFVEPLAGLRLDPRDPTDLAEITGLQARLAGLASALRSWIVLLDVPPGLDDPAILRWRGRFDTAWAAAYHPWPSVVVPEDGRGVPVRVPPSAAAAGVVALTEHRSGVPHGPANRVVEGAVSVADAVDPPRHDRLHPEGVNVLVRDRDGVRLTGARTLSRDRAWRQLSVRRLVTLVARTLEREMQWVVFEPNDRGLRERVRHLVTVFLRRLHAAGAFTGAREEDAFFVRCDDGLNPAPVVDAGRLVAEVGLAPAEPTEFILLRLERGGDGSLRMEG